MTSTIRREPGSALAAVLAGDSSSCIGACSDVTDLLLESGAPQATTLSPGAIEIVHATDLWSVPPVAPVALSRPVLLSVRVPDDELVPGVSAIAARIAGPLIELLVEDLDGGVHSVSASVWWSGEVFPESDATDQPWTLSHHTLDSETTADQVLRFVVVYSLLLEANRSPLEFSHPDRKPAVADLLNLPREHCWHVILQPKVSARLKPRSGLNDFPPDRRRRVEVRAYLRYEEESDPSGWQWYKTQRKRRWVNPVPMRYWRPAPRST